MPGAIDCGKSASQNNLKDASQHGCRDFSMVQDVFHQLRWSESSPKSPCGGRREQTPTNFPELHIQAMACACTPYQPSTPSHNTGDGGREGRRERRGRRERWGSLLKTFSADTNVLKIQKSAVEILYPWRYRIPNLAEWCIPRLAVAPKAQCGRFMHSFWCSWEVVGALQGLLMVEGS